MSRVPLKYFPVSVFPSFRISLPLLLKRDHIRNLRHALVDFEHFVAGCDLDFQRVGCETAAGGLFRPARFDVEEREHFFRACLWNDELKRKEAGPLVVVVQRGAKGIYRFLI